jgi:hypothetical protein
MKNEQVLLICLMGLIIPRIVYSQLPSPNNGSTYVITHPGVHNGIQTDQVEELVHFLHNLK